MSQIVLDAGSNACTPWTWLKLCMKHNKRQEEDHKTNAHKGRHAKMQSVEAFCLVCGHWAEQAPQVTSPLLNLISCQGNKAANMLTCQLLVNEEL
eukprot:1138598-Pelagomonas_calceolata.AAC.1